ncbi:MAG TPA: PA domain-containing protein, partial [Bryobacteraceae bacterium]
MRRFWIVSLAAVAVSLWAQSPAVINPEAYLAHIKYLASPELKGRATGSPELETAANYIAAQFQSFGLKPPSRAGYQQAFTTTVGARLGPNNRVEADDAGKASTLALHDGFVPFTFSSSGSAAAPVVFVGYGITANEYHYDDYAGVDVKDKFVVLVRHEPQENDEKSVFQGKELTQHATFAIKAVNAKMHGARGVILVNDTYTHPGGGDK